MFMLFSRMCVSVCMCACVVRSDSAEQHKHNASSEYKISHTERVS